MQGICQHSCRREAQKVVNPKYGIEQLLFIIGQINLTNTIFFYNYLCEGQGLIQSFQINSFIIKSC
jgi:hypothetical protein